MKEKKSSRVMSVLSCNVRTPFFTFFSTSQGTVLEHIESEDVYRATFVRRACIAVYV